MSIRALWIVSPLNENKVLYSRKFPTVDCRSKRFLKEKFVPIPDNKEFGEILLVSVGIEKKFPEFVEWRDSCQIESALPVIEFQTQHGKLWPVVAIEHYSLLLCCLPFVEECDIPLLEIPSVTVGCAILQGVGSVLGPVTSAPPNESWSKLVEVDTYLSLSMPLGTPYDTDPHNVKAVLSYSTPLKGISADSQKVPGWKPLPHHGKSTLSLSVREYVRSVQWGHSFISTTVYGNLLVRAQLEGPRTDVTLPLTSDDPSGQLPFSIKSMQFHPCLHNTIVSSPETAARKLKFRPPLQPFSLCNFAFDPTEPPIGGIYELSSVRMGAPHVNVLLNLRLSPKIRNNFEFFEAKLPFPTKKPIRHANCTPSWGMVQLSDDKQTLIWNLGQSFPTKSLEATLNAEVHFETDKAQPGSSANNSNNYMMSLYAQINFVVKDFTISGFHVKPKSVQVSPVIKVGVQTERSLRSTDYKIWNRNGTVPFCTEVPVFD